MNAARGAASGSWAYIVQSPPSVASSIAFAIAYANIRDACASQTARP